MKQKETVQNATHSVRQVVRRRHRGANLALLLAVGVMIVGFMGVSVYTGFQAYLQGELQRAVSTAAQVGASAYYSGTGSYGKPAPNATNAMSIAKQAFDTAIANSSSSLSAFGFQATSVTSNDSNDSITVVGKGTIPTAFLRPVGIQNIELNATATARALRYDPTRFTGPITIQPVSTDIASYSRVINLSFPLVDSPGPDLYVEQIDTFRQGYVIEACNDRDCFDLTPGATPMGTSKLQAQNGMNVIVGTALIDLARAGVRKASKLRITHGNDFTFYSSDGTSAVFTSPAPLVINRILLFGYAGNCVNSTLCPIPAGFSPVE